MNPPSRHRTVPSRRATSRVEHLDRVVRSALPVHTADEDHAPIVELNRSTARALAAA